MPINVSEALDSDTCVKVQVERTTPGNYVDGIYVSGTTSIFNTLVSPQQPSPKQLEVLPEGERDKDVMLFISKRFLRTVDDDNELPADVVLFKGERYRIIQLADWSTFGHTPAYGVKDDS